MALLEKSTKKIGYHSKFFLVHLCEIYRIQEKFKISQFDRSYWRTANVLLLSLAICILVKHKTHPTTSKLKIVIQRLFECF